MTRSTITAAFASEAEALVTVAAGLSRAELQHPGSCPPWTVGELLSHVIVATGRVRQALAGPADGPDSRLVATADYYRPDERFSPAANADRIEVASKLSARLGTAAAMSAELDRVSQDSLRLLAAAASDRTVRTRHGDRMLLTDFAVTRIVELGVHGLDLAISLDRPPWLTGPAATVLLELLLPGGQAGRVHERLGGDEVTLIAKLTGRLPLPAAEQDALRDSGVTRLTLG